MELINHNKEIYRYQMRKIFHFGEFLVFILLFFLLQFSNSCNVENTPQKTITVISYNIHYGIGMDGKYDLPRIAGIISNQNPDIVGLQEIGDSSMAAELGHLTSMKFVFGPSLGKMDGYGDAILCKHPFKWIENYSLPSASSSRYQAMAIDIDLSGVYKEATKIRFINTHFDYLKTLGSDEARMATVDVIEKGFFRGDTIRPSILTGDLNSSPESEPLKKLLRYGWRNENLGKDLKTIRSNNPERQIDYVLFRSKKNWNVVDVKVLNEPMASDHRPIVMSLSLKK